MRPTRIVVLDTSGSMSSPFTGSRSHYRPARVTSEMIKFRAALKFVEYLASNAHPAHRLLLIAFDVDARVVYDGVAGDQRTIAAVLARLSAEGGATDLEAGLQLALDQVNRGDADSVGYLDVVSDGLANRGNPIRPALELQNLGLIINLYLIDDTHEGRATATEVAGDRGKVETFSSDAEFSLRYEEAETARAGQLSKAERSLRELESRRTAFHRSVSELERPLLTAAFPAAVKPKEWYLMELFLYLRRHREVVLEQVPKLGQVFGSSFDEFTSSLGAGIPEGATVSISLSSDEFVVNPDGVSFRWFESYYRYPFRICGTAPVDSDRDSAGEIQAAVSVNGIPVGELRVPIGWQEKGPATEIDRRDLNWYENVFASYDHEDAGLVKEMRERYAALGIYLFVDSESIRTGEFWQEVLRAEIKKSDIFQLFWSHASRTSDYVTWEWTEAMRLVPNKSATFVRPVYWQEPMPEVPEKLRELHFRRLSFAVPPKWDRESIQ